jgi:hypothetical protein
MSFYSGTQMECLYALPAAVTKNTYTTQACMSSLAATAPVAKIPGGFFGGTPGAVGRSLFLKAMGSIATTSAATFSPAIALDSTAGTALNPITIYSTVAPTAAVTAQWDLEAWLTCQAQGESGGTTVQVNGKWVQSSVASGGALNATGWSAQFAGSLTGLLASTTYYVELFGTWSASAAGNTTTLQEMFLFGLN